VAFRVAQSLPRFILQALDESEQMLAEKVIAKAFEAANVDLTQFAANWDLDISASGTAVTVALRQRDTVHVAWLGDARVLVATVVGDDSRVDLMAKSHTPAEPAELQRLTRQGAEIGRETQKQGFTGHRQESIRVYRQTNTGDSIGLSVSRALGDTAFSSIGVIGHPDLAKTSFASTPGLILLASGGAWEFLGDGEAVVDNLLRDGQLGYRGPQHALSRLCDIAQDRWQGQEPGCFEDITGLLLHWPSEDDAMHATVPPQTSFAAPQSHPPMMAKVLHAEPQRFLQAQPSVSVQQVQAQGTAWTTQVVPTAGAVTVSEAAPGYAMTSVPE
jgi:serine/threonine protein phosphatase PrpC